MAQQFDLSDLPDHYDLSDLPDQYPKPKQPGNIDVSTLPAIHNPDGTVSTVKSFSIGTDKGEVLIPQVVDGQLVSKADAIAHYKATGQHLGVFKNADDADAYAQFLHQSEAARVVQASSKDSIDAQNAARAQQGFPPMETISADTATHAPEPQSWWITRMLDKAMSPFNFDMRDMTYNGQEPPSMLPIKAAREDLRQGPLGRFMGPEPKPGSVDAALDNVATGAVEGLARPDTMMTLPAYELAPVRYLAAAQALAHGAESGTQAVQDAMAGRTYDAAQGGAQSLLDLTMGGLLGKEAPHDLGALKRKAIDRFFTKDAEEQPAAAKIAEQETAKNIIESAQAQIGNQNGQSQSDTAPAPDLPPTIAIGRDVGGEKNALSVEKLWAALQKNGIDLSRKPYDQAGSERTFILNPNRALSESELTNLARDTGQIAVPQYANGEGMMGIPDPSQLNGNPEWGKFNPDFMPMLDKSGQPTSLSDLLEQANASRAKEAVNGIQPDSTLDAISRSLQTTDKAGLKDEATQYLRQQGIDPAKADPYEIATALENVARQKSGVYDYASQIDSLSERADELKNQLGNYIDRGSSPEKDTVQDKLWQTYSQIHKLREKSGQPRDFVIIGGGAGGLKAAGHAAYEGADTLVLERRTTTGGQASRSQEIVNTGASDSGITGRQYFRSRDLTARNRGAQIRTGVSVNLAKMHVLPDGTVAVPLSSGEVIRARRVALAMGASPNVHPGFDLAGWGNAERLTRLSKGKVGMVYGAGNSATQAVFGAVRNGAKKVVMVSRRPFGPEASADQVSRLKALEKDGKVQFVTGQISGIEKNPTGGVKVNITNTETGQPIKSFDVAHVENFLDTKLNTGSLPKEIKTTPGPNGKAGPVKVLDASLKTTMPGVYAMGDIRESLPGEERPRRIDMAEGDAAGVTSRVIRDIYNFRKHGKFPAWTNEPEAPEGIDESLKTLKDKTRQPTTGQTTNTGMSSTTKPSPTLSEAKPKSVEKTNYGAQNTDSNTSSATLTKPIGISNKAIKEQAEAGRYSDESSVSQEPGKGTSVADLRAEGIQAARDGEPFNEAVARLQQGGHDVSRLRTEYERLAYETDKAQQLYQDDPTTERRNAYDTAQKAEADFYNNTVKAVKAPVSDALRAFQGREAPDAETFAGLSRIARAEKGSPLTPREEVKIKRNVDTVQNYGAREQQALNKMSRQIEKMPIRSNRMVLDTESMRTMFGDLKDRLTPCQK